MLIRKLLFHYQVDPNVHYQCYSEEEEEDDDSSGSSREEEEELPEQHVDLEEEYERFQADMANIFLITFSNLIQRLKRSEIHC